ncbi:hypothetical protein LX70_03728 [Defluviimonas denitrificans]|jgi:hypothetical protein|uniref:Secreted protein with PEP-CTERM sorting signal n=1 Tax=Albidovulum denitrificans TaxID=404881 RepID=A0A2S8RYX5_9RHOB|nr:hypothetical protein [Defluviimonas denitrificans]PQV53721.1 hypothetical protein LX70_03728 [Defluviimonas denitrificans]
MKKLSLSAAATLLAGPALAHQGHEAAREIGALHWVSEPDHAIAVVLTVAAALFVGVVLLRSRRG